MTEQECNIEGRGNNTSKGTKQETSKYLLWLEYEIHEGKQSLWSDQRCLNASLGSLGLTVEARWRVSQTVSKLLESLIWQEIIKWIKKRLTRFYDDKQRWRWSTREGNILVTQWRKCSVLSKSHSKDNLLHSSASSAIDSWEWDAWA